MKRIIDISDALYEKILNNKVQNGSIASRVALNLIQSSVPYTGQEQKWTPVSSLPFSEDMPDAEEECWLAVKYFDPKSANVISYSVERGEWRDESYFDKDKREWIFAGQWVDENGINIEGGNEICKVIAWMPLVIPKAYDEHGLNDGSDEDEGYEDDDNA